MKKATSTICAPSWATTSRSRPSAKASFRSRTARSSPGSPGVTNSLEESEKAFGRRQSFVAGPPRNGVQFMVKDSRKYAATDGWGFAQFNDGKPADEAVHNACFSCHAIVKARDYIFNRYAP